jgi:hypothetical protein
MNESPQLIAYLNSCIDRRMRMPDDRIVKVIAYSFDNLPKGYRWKYLLEYEDTGEQFEQPVRGMKIGTDQIF